MDASVYDAVIIGGGIVGCAVARRLTLDGAKVALLEAGNDILCGASKANSALLHTGFDAPPGSLELAAMQAGYREYLEIRSGLNLPLLETGAMVVAWTEEEAGKLDSIEAQAHQNGVGDVRRLSAAEALAREPRLSAKLRAALLVPGEHVIDPWSAPLAYLTQAVLNGAEARFATRVEGGRFEGGDWRLTTSKGDVRGRAVINCAGLFADVVEERLMGRADFRIKPRKGQFVVFDKAASTLLRTIILPVPTERTKGVVLARTIFGNLLVGPTAEEQDDRLRASVDHDTVAMLIAKAEDMVPGLAGMPVTALYAGLRPATERKEYRVAADAARQMIRVGGIRSTGLTAALGLAQYVAARLAELADGGSPFFSSTPPVTPRTPRVPNLAEHEPRDWQSPGHGDIICHCELVTHREIEAALAGPLPAGDAGGLKRRTRAGMGRCQGFYCQARIASLSAGRFASPPTIGAAHG